MFTAHTFYGGFSAVVLIKTSTIVFGMVIYFTYSGLPQSKAAEIMSSCYSITATEHVLSIGA